jgi:hypothetical protein
MITAKLHYRDTLKTIDIKPPTSVEPMLRLGQKPYKCVITGTYSEDEAMELEAWVNNNVKPFMDHGYEIKNIAVKTTEDPAPARVDKQDPEGIMRFFEYEHLPLQLQKVSAPLCDLAQKLDKELPNGAEKVAGLRKLLEAKDCFVRASFDK